MAFTWSEVTTPDTLGDLLRDIIYAPEIDLFVGVGDDGLVLTSPTGAVWTKQTAASAALWKAVAWNGSILVAVGASAAMTSPDGVTWTSRTAAEANVWSSVVWADGLSLFVAVSEDGANRVMTSPDGITWTSRSAAAAQVWKGVAWNGTVLCAISRSDTTQGAMTSTDGIAWTLRTTHGSSAQASGTVYGSSTIAWSPTLSLFAAPWRTTAVATRFINTSPDGVTWTRREFPVSRSWMGMVWMPAVEQFACVAQGERICFSSDGITWTEEDMNQFRLWDPLAWSDELARLVSFDNGDNDAMLLGVYASVDSVTPPTGTYLGGTVVTVGGRGFTGATQVTFGGIAAVGVVVTNDTTLTCITPAHASGVVDVAVVGVGTLTGGYTYVSVIRVSPKAGTAAGWTAVTITGSGFAGATSVLFDGVAATSVVVVSDTTITAVTPLHASGTVDVTVVGVDTGTGLYTYTLPLFLLPPIPVLSPVEATAPPGTISAEWQRWLQAVKLRVEQAPSLFAEQVTGVFNPNQIPDLPFTRITLTTAPRLLGRTSAGAGPAEEIRVAAGLTLTGGILSLSGLPGGLTAGSVMFAGTNGALSQDNASFFWDDTNNRLGIGTIVPDVPLHVKNDYAGSTRIEVENMTDAAGSEAALIARTSTGAISGVGMTSPLWGTYGALGGNVAYWYSNATLLLMADNPASGAITLATGGSAATFKFDIAGNLLIGTPTSPATGTAALIFGDGTTPATLGSNTAGLYANDVGGTVHMFAIDESGTVTQLSGLTSAYTPTNVTTDRSYDANATTLDELADVLGTLIADLQARGICG